MATHNVLVIRKEMSFMVNALITNVERAGYVVSEASFNEKEIEPYKDKAEVILLYADDGLCTRPSLLLYLKELCKKEDKLVILIGSRQEIQDISEHIPPHLLADIMERPLDMNFFIDKLRALLGEDELSQRRKTILLVDDDVSCLQLLREWLKDDYRIGMARYGMQAITWLARNDVDLILLDYEMPVTSGAQVFEMLKSEEYSKNIPVMFLTGKSDRESIMKVMELKPEGYMLKSINKRTLLETVEHFFAKQK